MDREITIQYRTDRIYEPAGSLYNPIVMSVSCELISIRYQDTIEVIGYYEKE